MRLTCGFMHLLKKAKRWRKATMLRDYINAVETKNIENGNVSEDYLLVVG